MKDVGGAVLAGSSPPFRGREQAAVDVDVGPERRSPRYHETCLAHEHCFHAWRFQFFNSHQSSRSSRDVLPELAPVHEGCSDC